MCNVLIVEDDPMVAEINRGYLERTGGFQLAGVVPDSARALMFLRDAPVDLVLLDIHMPGKSGLALLREIRATHPDVDVIMITAVKKSADIQEALRLGVIDYIVKPFTFERVQAALIAYQERMRLLHSEDELTQDILDKRIFAKNRREQDLPKGIQATTLKLVHDTLAGYDGEFRICDISALLGLSRVSLKKYLEHLEASGCLSKTLFYLPVGRPTTLYRWIAGRQSRGD